MTPENVRFHAAGHVAAAVALVQSGNIDGAKTVCRVVRSYVYDAKVSAPEQVRAMADQVCDAPTEIELGILERVLVDPLNTTIERSGH
jgi:hypothetical protein